MAARIYIGRLSNWARERDIERFLKGFGRIKDISVKNGYCFVVSFAPCFILHNALMLLLYFRLLVS